MNQEKPSGIRRFFNRRAWAAGLFWSWNIIFLAFMLFGFAPRVLPEILNAVRSDLIPAIFLLYALILTLIPAVTLVVGFTLLRHDPIKLFILGYGVEGPLMLMLAFRFFVVRQAPAAVTFFLLIVSIGMAAFLWQILDRRIDQRGALASHTRVIGLTLLLVVGLYASLWIAFYAVPVGTQGLTIIGDTLANLGQFFRNLGEELRRLLTTEIRWLPFAVLGFILLFYTATLFVLMPIAVPVLYGRAWWRSVRALAAGYGRRRTMATTAAVLIICALLIVLTNRQPQHKAFALLETQPTSAAEAQALLGQEEAIRRGLLNAYLAPQRYISAVGEVDHVSRIYEHTVGLSRQQAAGVQRFYETVARPVLYEPVNPQPDEEIRAMLWENRALRQEPWEAAELYETFFDETIIEGERETVVAAARATWSIDQAQAAWQAVDDREIYLTQQEVNVTENGDWAEVELYEVYQNQTGRRQEVVYYFSLPESAVITGVWLGNSADRDERFAYRVSPRGAAQALYRNEVRRNLDPALVEQIGPRQYRLRVFPVEPQRWRWDNGRDRSTVEEAPPLHMWLTWRVLATDNAWPLPRLAEKRNVYWDDDSARLLNGEPMAAGEETWLPASVPATNPVEPLAHRVEFPSGEAVVMQPVATEALPALPNDLRLAVVLDRSRSMVDYAAEVEAALAQLAEMAQEETAVDLYLTASPYRGEEPTRTNLSDFDPGDIMYYGGQNAAELLVQFDALHNDEAYDAVFVLTDGSGYELDDSGMEVPVPDAPLWMVHLGGDFPLGYDDGTLQAIQASGGGVTGGTEEAITRFAVAHSGIPAIPAEAGSSVDFYDGYAWLTTNTAAATAATAESHAPSDDFTAFAARRIILAEMQRQRADLGQMPILDYLHAIAIEHSIVTPYSSMIVLVTSQQEKMLDALEARGDRFEREYEEIGETAPENAFTVTGVPEPEEWLLLGLAAAMLTWYFYKTRRGTLRDGRFVS